MNLETENARIFVIEAKVKAAKAAIVGMHAGQKADLVFAIVGWLLATFAARNLGVYFAEQIARLETIRTAGNGYAADLAQTQYLARPWSPHWPLEQQILYDLAEALRRACDTDREHSLPLLIYGAREMCARYQVDAGPLDALIVKHGGAP